MQVTSRRHTAPLPIGKCLGGGGVKVSRDKLVFKFNKENMGTHICGERTPEEVSIASLEEGCGQEGQSPLHLSPLSITYCKRE